ncbi:STAS domain-containing protein [Nocardioides sp. zg-DK7169]|uniref:STAS domain-containing protein n=1 Tax=Nocardioides sp. zg-DK7169 TaxID=2736600 RepID=UPI0020A67946|nr:STAS domain-containing protein [Nocardioides sp. zg-DK7169]NPC98341.1 STAS domain-containing protein [Nocardioides sp. zg-DK7169]
MEERPFSATISSGVLTVSGSVDEYAVIALRNAVREHTEDYTIPLHIDLSDADYLPSVAVSVLVTALRTAEQNGTTLTLVAEPGTIAQRVLLVCALPYVTSLDGDDSAPSGPSVVA